IQKQWHSVVVGAEAVYMWMDQKETSGSIAFDTSLTGTAKSVFLVSGKLGVAWDNILGYAKAGYAIGDVDYRTHTTSTGALLSTSSRQEQGWTAGVGIEYAIWDHIILGVAYDYVQLSVASRVQTAVGGGPLPTTVTNAAVDTQSVTGRLSFKFGGG